jgi:hypothetical protein
MAETSDNQQQSERVLREVSRFLKELRYGSIEIQVHDGQVVSIERRERTRFSSSAPRQSAER